MGLISASSRTIERDIGGEKVKIAKLSYRDKAAILAWAKFADDEDDSFVRFLNQKLMSNGAEILEYAIAKANPAESKEDVEATVSEAEADGVLFDLVCEVCNLKRKAAPEGDDPLPSAGATMKMNTPNPAIGDSNDSASLTGSAA